MRNKNIKKPSRSFKSSNKTKPSTSRPYKRQTKRRKRLLNREIKAHNDKILYLENELKIIIDNHRAVVAILSEYEDTLRKKTDYL